MIVYLPYVKAAIEAARARFMQIFNLESFAPSRDIRSALNTGTTLTTRLWVALLSVTLGAQLWINQPPVFTAPGYSALLDTVPLWLWSAAFLLSGLLMLWRVVTTRSRPVCGWISNFASMMAWGSLVVSRVFYLGWPSLASYSTIVFMMATWLLVRTEATERDVETI